MGEYIKHNSLIDAEEIKIGVCRGKNWCTWFAKEMLILLERKGFQDWYGGEFTGGKNMLEEFINSYEEMDTSYIKYYSIEDILEEYPEYEEIFKIYTDKELEHLWSEFGDIPMNPETEEIEEEFLFFPIGTHREEIWYWFDEEYPKGVIGLMYPEK